jgi:tripartite-type tricarboxylate transporter receptor subunit TctC
MISSILCFFETLLRSQVSLAPYLFVVNPSVPATIPEFIAYAKANPGKLSMGITAAGTQVAGELFKTMAGIDVQQVPYRGDAPGLTDLIGGRIEIFLGGVAASIEHVKSGRIRALAVTTATRSQIMPSVPALQEFLPGYEASIVYGVGAPKVTSAEIINKLDREINAGLADPNITARFSDLGASVFPTSPAEFGKFIGDETEKWAKVVGAANIKAD